MDIEDLNGVGAKTAKKLERNGFQDLETIALSSTKTLHEKTGVGEGRAQKILEAAREEVQGGDFQTGEEVLEQQNDLKKITTSSDALDDMMYGGIPTNYITQAYGKNGRGKTQLALQLAVNVQLSEDEGGLGKKCLFVDTENTFEAERFVQMAEAHGLDSQEALRNVIVAETTDSEHQMKISEKLFTKCAEEDIGLVIVDSLMAEFRSDFSGREELANRQDLVGQHLKELGQLARTFDLAVYVTNQVLSDPGQMFGDPTSPIGGNVVGHNSDFIIYLKGKKNRSARLVDSPSLPPKDVEFAITEEGIRDV